MTAEVSPCTPEEFWGDDETPATGHRAANVRDFPCCDTPTRPRNRDNARAAGFDTTAEWITDLCTKLAAAEAEVARLTPKPGCRVCGRTDCATT